MHLAGDGPLADWHGQLRTTAGDVATLDADFRIQGDGGRYRVATQGTALVAALLPPKLQPLLAGETRFATTASFDDNAMVLDALDLSAAPGTLSASGQWQRDSDAISGQATLDLPALAAFAPLLGNDIAGRVKLALALTGKRTEPAAHITLSGDHVEFAGNRVAQATAAIDLHAAGDPLAAATPIDVAGSGNITDLVLAAAALPGGLGDSIGWHVAAKLDRQTMRIAVSELGIASAGNTLAAHGSGDAGGDVAGAAHLEMPEVARLAGTSLHGALALDIDVQTEPAERRKRRSTVRCIARTTARRRSTDCSARTQNSPAALHVSPTARSARTMCP